MSKWVGVGGSWKAVTNQYVGVGGSWKQIEQTYVGVGGSWKLSFSALAETHDTYTTGSDSGSESANQVYTTPDTPNLVVTGGSGTYTYLWAQISQTTGNAPTCVSPTSANPAWYAWVEDGTASESVWRCTITDTVYGNSIVSTDAIIRLVWVQT